MPLVVLFLLLGGGVAVALSFFLGNGLWSSGGVPAIVDTDSTRPPLPLTAEPGALRPKFSPDALVQGDKNSIFPEPKPEPAPVPVATPAPAPQAPAPKPVAAKKETPAPVAAAPQPRKQLHSLGSSIFGNKGRGGSFAPTTISPHGVGSGNFQQLQLDKKLNVMSNNAAPSPTSSSIPQIPGMAPAVPGGGQMPSIPGMDINQILQQAQSSANQKH